MMPWKPVSFPKFTQSSLLPQHGQSELIFKVPILHLWVQWGWDIGVWTGLGLWVGFVTVAVSMEVTGWWGVGVAVEGWVSQFWTSGIVYILILTISINIVWLLLNLAKKWTEWVSEKPSSFTCNYAGIIHSNLWIMFMDTSRPRFV